MRKLLLFLFLALSLAGLSPRAQAATSGTNLTVWQNSASYYFDPTNELPANATSGQFIDVTTAGNGLTPGLYGIQAVSIAYSAPGTNGNGHNLVSLISVNADGSVQNPGHTPVTTIATTPQSGATWYYGATPAAALAAAAAASPPTYAWARPSPNTTVTGTITLQLDGDSRVQYQGNRLQAEVQRLFPSATVTVNNGGNPGVLTAAFLPSATRFAQLVSYLNAHTVKVYFLSTGVNDSKHSVSTPAAVYQFQTQQIVDALYAQVPTLRAVVLAEPFYTVPGSGGGDFDAGSNTLQQAYIGAQNNVLRATVMPGLDAFFRANPSLLVDGVHPTPGDGQSLTPPYPINDGQAAEVSNWATGLANVLSALPASQPAPPALSSAPALASGTVPVLLTWGALPARATAFRLYRDSVTTPIYDGPLTAFSDAVAPASAHSYALSAYNASGETAKVLLTAASSAQSAPLTLTATAGVNSEVLTWTADSGAANGYEVDWKPSSVLPVAGQVKSIVAIVGTGVLTWTDTSAYRLAQSGRYNVVGLH